MQFTFIPEGAGAGVTWAMQSKKPFIGKVTGLFMECEKMCGDHFSERLVILNMMTTSAPRS